MAVFCYILQGLEYLIDDNEIITALNDIIEYLSTHDTHTADIINDMKFVCEDAKNNLSIEISTLDDTFNCFYKLCASSTDAIDVLDLAKCWVYMGLLSKSLLTPPLIVDLVEKIDIKLKLANQEVRHKHFVFLV